MTAPNTTTTTSAVHVPPMGRYEIDPQASTVTLRGRHLFGLGRVTGSFAIRRGVIDVADPIGDSRLEVEIDTTTFHTGNPQRDANVRSARLLDTDRFPMMTFTSGRLDRSGADTTLAGTLTVREIDRPVSLLVEHSAVRPGRPRSFVAHATTRIDRTEFGVTAMRGLAGRHFDVALQVVAVAR